MQLNEKHGEGLEIRYLTWSNVEFKKKKKTTNMHGMQIYSFNQHAARNHSAQTYPLLASLQKTTHENKPSFGVITKTLSMLAEH